MGKPETKWYRRDLGDEHPEPSQVEIELKDATTEDGFESFVRTHMEAFGERPDKETFELYRLDVNDGVIHKDRMFTFLRNGAPSGCVSFSVMKKPDGSEFILLDNLGVPVSLQGNGLGYTTLSLLLSRLRGSFDPETLVLCDVWAGNRASRAILEKLGFQEIEQESWFPLPPEAGD